MLKRPHYIAFSVVALLVLVLLNLPSRTAAQLKVALGGFFIPMFGLGKSTQTITEAAGKSLLPRKVLLEENEALLKENEKLKILAAQGAQIWRENAQLRQALNWQKTAPWNLKLARVLAREPSNWWRNLQIDLGSHDGLATNMTVLTAEGLVGKVDQVNFRNARVLLLGDPYCRVAAMIEETRDSGVITAGSGSILDQSVVELTFLPRKSLAKPGQRVVTSGATGLFPKGILIGQIIDTNSVDYGLYLEARVKLAADLKQLDHVWVVFP